MIGDATFSSPDAGHPAAFREGDDRPSMTPAAAGSR